MLNLIKDGVKVCDDDSAILSILLQYGSLAGAELPSTISCQ